MGLIVGIIHTVRYCILEIEKLGISGSCKRVSKVLLTGLFAT